MASASLIIHAIGKGLSQTKGLLPKHAIKQVDRLLSNKGIDVWQAFAYWVPQVVAERKDILVAMDWTEFDKDGHSSIVLSLVTNHGRATPLIWRTVEKDKLKDNRNAHEDALLVRLAEVLPHDVHVTILADRGFGDQTIRSCSIFWTMIWDLTTLFDFAAIFMSLTLTEKPFLRLSG